MAILTKTNGEVEGLPHIQNIPPMPKVKPPKKESMNNKLRIVHWEYEDQLPIDDNDNESYNLMYPMSIVNFGVRMFPYIRNEEGDRVFLYSTKCSDTIR